MPDFDANSDLARLPGAGPGSRLDPALAHGPAPVQLASMTASRPAPGHHSIAARPSSRGLPSAGGADALAEQRSMVILRYLDVVLVAVAAIPALALGAPALGHAIGAGAWVAQRIIAVLDRRWISNTTAPRTQLGLNLFEAFARIWLLAGAIVLAGVAGGRADGLTAALVIFAAYSVAFAVRVITGPPQRKVLR